MPTLQVMLAEADEALLEVLVSQWGVDARRLSQAEIREVLGKAMLDPARVEKVFDGLDSNARGALQTLAGNQASRNKMALPMFEALSGSVRRLGKGGIERDKPHVNPASPAESLFYKGLIAITSDRVGSGLGFVAYIPDDLAVILPLHKTGYSRDVLEAEAAVYSDDPAVPTDVSDQVMTLDSAEIEEVRVADTRIVDDMTTLLAFLQLTPAGYDPYKGLDVTSLAALMPHLLGQDETRLAFLVTVGISGQLIYDQEGRLYVHRTEGRQWLELARPAQLRRLVEAWQGSSVLLELFLVPGLNVDDTPSYDPAAAREALISALRDETPHYDWWALDSFIEVMYARHADFQRPGGDYDSWYIRNDSGEYLRGVESWHAVDGAAIEFTVIGPLHWLGLLDVAENAARFNAYGRSFLDSRWPQPSSESDEPIEIQDDGTLLVSRKASRFERVQLARFTSWVAPATLDGNPYVYRLDAGGVQRAAAQNISTENIAKFVTRVTGVPLPEPVLRLLQNWRSGPTASVSLESQIILRTTAPETLDMIFNEPTLRRYLGARLGDMACIVRADQWEALTQALGQRGIGVDRGF
jgi:hypothetical protein